MTRSPGRARAIILTAALLAACETPTIPGRDPADVYRFDLPTQPPAVLRWPVGRTVRVYVVDSSTGERTALLRTAFENGAAAWNEAALFTEYRLERASDLAGADVVLAFSDVLLPVDTDDCRPAVAQAVTTFCIEDDGTGNRRLHSFPLLDGAGPGQVKMIVLVLAAESNNPAVVDRLVAHELGHVLGIGRHSDDERDLMWRVDQKTARPTRRDAATIQVLYHVRADIIP